MHTEANLSAPHPTPSWTAVVREQFRAVGASLRVELVVAGALMAGLSLLILLDHLHGGKSIDFALVDMAAPMVVFAIFAPLGVWKGEEPSRRAYLWTLPVARSRHTLVKVFSGWGWLMALVGTYLLWAVTMTLLTGGDFGVGGDHTQAVTQRHLPPAERIRELSLEPWMWLVPFTGASVTYLAGTVVAVWTDRPWRWFAALAFVTVLVVQMVDAVFGAVNLTMNGVTAGRYGLLTLITGLPSAERWAGATLIWMSLALAGVVAAAHRHQER
jgi:hypothetical protein